MAFKIMKAPTAEQLTRQLNGLVVGKTDLVRGKDQSPNPAAAPNNLYKHPIGGLTLVFNTPAVTVTFSGDLDFKQIISEVNTAAGVDIAYLYKVDGGPGMVLAFWDDTTPVDLDDTGTANSYFGFSTTAADPTLVQLPIPKADVHTILIDFAGRQYIAFYI
jgi:hypothetical protein